MFIKRTLNKKISLWHRHFSPADRVAYNQQPIKCDKLLHKHYARIES